MKSEQIQDFPFVNNQADVPCSSFLREQKVSSTQGRRSVLQLVS